MRTQGNTERITISSFFILGLCVCERERERERGREGGREGGRERGREGGREREREEYDKRQFK